MACDLPRLTKKNIEAFMFIVVEPDAEDDVLFDLMRIKGITEYSRLYGVCDLYCKLEVDSMERFREICARIKRLRILTTQTLITRREEPKTNY